MTTATDIQAMLANRHIGDVYVPECKDGPTQTRAHRRLDAWVLLKTWSPITTIGYEIKIDRADWRRDEKLHDYMPLCHLLYVVAPSGVVPIEELPSGVGLMQPVGSAGRLQIKRKAARREIALPGELMVYVLMCRTKITRERDDMTGERNWRVDELREWVTGRKERQDLSYAVSQKIQAAFAEQRQQLARERERNDQLEGVRTRIAELGFDAGSSVDFWKVRERLNALGAIVDRWMLADMRRLSKQMSEMADKLQGLKDGRADTEDVA